jgi:DNA-binding response OmpR family regulator
MTGESSKKKILLVEDEKHLAFTLSYNLEAEGYEVKVAENGELALRRYQQEGPFDLIILDIMLPEIDGFEVARRIRAIDKTTGILMLTARATENDILSGLAIGADDYLTKPFILQELMLRVKRMLERSGMMIKANTTRKLVSGHIELDLDNLELKSVNGTYQITSLEAELLGEFLQNPQKILTREHLLKTVWGSSGRIETRTVDNFIMRIRKYIDLPNSESYILTVRGKGYKFQPPTSP